jgi:plasmid stabilization system protein ParE
MARSPARMTPEAREWFLAEIAYIANLNPAAAEKIVARVKKARQLLADHPKIGPAGLIPGTRRFVVKPYILTVRQRDGVVEIAAIRHAKQSDAYTPHLLLAIGAEVQKRAKGVGRKRPTHHAGGTAR